MVCCLRTGLQNGVADLVKASCQLNWRLWQLTDRSAALQRPAGLSAHNTMTCDGFVHADAVCNTSRLIASMNVSCLWCLNVTHVM